MYRLGRVGRHGSPKHNERIRRSKPYPTSGRDIVRRDEQFRIAPKHPGMGRR